MIKNQRKMMMNTTTRNSQWNNNQKSKEYQSKGGIFQRTEKYHSTGIKRRKMKRVEKLMFSDEDAPLRFKVISNHLILKNIVAQMTFSTLKAARLVCKEWKKLANLELERRKCARMRFSENWRGEPRNFRKLVDVSFMEFDFNRIYGVDLEHFLALFGHQVKIMKLESSEFSFWDFQGSRWEPIWNFIAAGKFPNLEILRFHKGSNGFLRRRHGLGGIQQRRLQLPSNTGKISSNLKKIEGIHLSHVSRFPPQFFLDKGHLVKSVELDSWYWDDLTLIAQTRPKLERLVIKEVEEDWMPEVFKQIRLMLKSSRESLETLQISLFSASPFYFQPQISRKQSYSKLSTLHLSMDCSGVNLKHQLESLNQECLPKLKTVKLEVVLWLKLDLADSISFSPGNRDRRRGGLTSVVNLGVICKHRRAPSCDLLPSYWFPWLSACFPNVRNLTTENWRDNDEVLAHVFVLWPKLSSLSIHFYHDSTSEDNVDLDPVFTGLSVEKFQELQKHPEKIAEQILTERTWPNLHSLKELKRLDFVLTGIMSPPFWCPLSLISFLYAINLRPELKTAIRFPEKAHGYRKFLEPIAPYARLEGFTGTDWKF